MIEWENCPTNGGMSPFSLEARDEDYDTYLFWPSLSNGMGASKESFVATYHTVIVSTIVLYKAHRDAFQSTPPSSDQVDYYSGWDTAPSVCPTYPPAYYDVGNLIVYSHRSP